MTQSEKETILVKLQELTTIIQGIPCQEATLFDQVTPTITTSGIPASETPTEEKPRRTRTRAKDGTMTAATMAHALSKELGREITKDSVIRVFLAFIGAATLGFLFTATEYDEDDIDQKESK